MTTYEPADWEPGDIAWIEADGTEPQHRLLYVTMAGNYRWHGADGFVSDVTSARRLQVVDPASTVVLDPDDVDAAIELLQRADMHMPGVNLRPDAEALCRALRSLLPSPTPPEPNGEFAVVVDQSHRAWHRRHNGMWSAAGEQERPWSLIGLGAIQYHGVGCSCGAPDCNGGDQ